MNIDHSVLPIKPLILTTLLAWMLSSPAFAHDIDNQMMRHGSMDMGHMGMGMHSQNLYMLNLIDTQLEELRKLRRTSRTKILSLQDEIAEHSDRLYGLYSTDKPDPKAIGDLYQKIFNIKRQIIELHINTKNQQYDLLTKEQQEKLKGWKTNRMSNRYDDNYRGMHHMMP